MKFKIGETEVYITGVPRLRKIVYVSQESEAMDKGKRDDVVKDLWD